MIFATESDTMIACQQFSFGYSKEHPVLRDISFHISAGEHTAILGYNGSGKSTLLRSLVGLNRGDGRIWVAGLEVCRKNLREVRKKVGYMFQDPQVQLFCPTVLEDVAFGPVNYHGDEARAEREAREALEAVGYQGKLFAPCHTLSLGEMRKVALAGILVLQPELLLLDEPDSFLDVRGRDMLVNILQEVPGITILLVTHDITFASSLCARAIVLEEGKVSYDGALSDAPQLSS